MTTPTIVQSAFGRTATQSTGSLTVTLGSTPTIGNSLLIVITGYYATWNLTTPIAIFGTLNILNQQIAVYYGPVCSATQGVLSYNLTITSPNGNTNMAVFEIQNAKYFNPSWHSYLYSFATTASTTLTTPSVMSPQDSGELRLAAVQWDNNAGVASIPSGWTLLSPTSWYGTVTGTNHNCGIWQIPASTSGTNSLTMAANLNTSGGVYGDIEIVQGSSVSTIISRADLASSKPAYVGKSISSPVATTAQKSAFQSATGAFYGSGDYLGQWSPAANSNAISGTIVENGLPVSKLVCLYNRQTGALVSTVHSNASTGFYSFTGLNPAITYQAVAFDSPQFNAQIYDNLTPG